jgi:hypothetical protein
MVAADDEVGWLRRAPAAYGRTLALLPAVNRGPKPLRENPLNGVRRGAASDHCERGGVLRAPLHNAPVRPRKRPPGLALWRRTVVQSKGGDFAQRSDGPQEGGEWKVESGG